MPSRTRVVKGFFCCLIFSLVLSAQTGWCNPAKLLIVGGSAQKAADSGDGSKETGTGGVPGGSASTVVLTLDEAQVDRLVKALALSAKTVEAIPAAEIKGGLVRAIAPARFGRPDHGAPPFS